MQKNSAFFLLIISSFFTSYIYAQQDSIELDPVTITATINPISLSNTGRNLLVITNDKIRKLPVNSIGELLRYLPGIEVQARGPMGAQSDFVLRGGTFQQVLVLLDGLRINDPLTGHFNSYLPIAPSEIERIEILKGASSAIYGTEAVGGVIQIISKIFAKRQNTLTKKSVQGQFMAGQYRLLNANAGGYFTKGKSAVSGGFLTNNASGQDQRGIKGFFHLHTFSISASHLLSEHLRIAIRSAFDHRRFAAQNFYTTFLSDTAQEKVNIFWNQVQLDYSKNKNAFAVNVGYKTGEDEYAFNKYSIANLNKSKLLQTLVTYSYQHNERTSLTSGMQFQNRKIRSNDRGNHQINQSAAFVLLHHQLSKSFNINPGARLDWNGQSGLEFVPQMNLSYRMANFQLRGSAGKTIREADFTERFNNYNKPIVNSGSIGNPDLIPERSFSYEAGGDYFIKNVAKVAVTYFQRRQKDLIDYVATPYSEIPRRDNLIINGSYAFAKNIASVITTGVETDLQLSKSFNEKYNIWASLGLLWLRSKSSEKAPSFYITSHAKFLTNFSLLFSAPHFNFSVNGLYKVREPKTAPSINAAISKDYFVMNAKAEVFIINKKLSLVTQVDNVFNRNYSDLLGSKMPGKWCMAGAKINL